MTDFQAKVTTEKATKHPVLESDQRTAVPRLNKSEVIEIESENMPKELAATTNETTPMTAPSSRQNC